MCKGDVALSSWTLIIGVCSIWEGGCPQPPRMRRVRTRALPLGENAPIICFHHNSLHVSHEVQRGAPKLLPPSVFFPLPYSRRSDVALRIDSRSPGMTSAPIFAAAKVSRPASFSEAPVQKTSFLFVSVILPTIANSFAPFISAEELTG